MKRAPVTISHRPGQAITEFAIAATVFLLALFGIMQSATAVLGYNTICAAARQAVRYAIIHGSTSSDASAIQQVAINAAPDLNLTASNVTVTFPADTSVPSQLDAKVVVTYNFSLAIPFMASTTIPLTATAQMPVSQ